MTTKAGVINVVAAFFYEKDLKWEKLVGVCTNFALAMSGSQWIYYQDIAEYSQTSFIRTTLFQQIMSD